MMFQFSTDIRGKEVNYRKWKVKDKKKLLSSNGDPIRVKEALVYDCIEDQKLGLSEDEYNYILFKIREASLPEKVTFDFKCSKCKNKFEYFADLNQIMMPEFNQYGDIQYGNHIFTMTDIRNREFYDKAIHTTADPDEKTLINFILHVKAYNDNDGYNFEEMNDILINLDVDVFESVFEQWEQMRFKVNNIENVECPECNHEELYEFDDLPGFFPKSWGM